MGVNAWAASACTAVDASKICGAAIAARQLRQLATKAFTSLCYSNQLVQHRMTHVCAHVRAWCPCIDRRLINQMNWQQDELNMPNFARFPWSRYRNECLQIC